MSNRMSKEHSCPLEWTRDPRLKRGYKGSSERPCHVPHLPPRPSEPPVRFVWTPALDLSDHAVYSALIPGTQY